MLSALQQARVRRMCREFHLGMVRFQDNGMIHFTSSHPIKQNIERFYEDFEITDSGSGPTMDDRVDDMRMSYWVTVRPCWPSDLDDPDIENRVV